MVKVIGVVVALFVLAWLGLVGSLAWQARAERKRMRARLARRSTAELREMVMTWGYLVQYETAEPVREFRELFDRADYAAILRRWRSLSAGLAGRASEKSEVLSPGPSVPGHRPHGGRVHRVVRESRAHP